MLLRSLNHTSSSLEDINVSKKYIINYKELKPGDIILTADKGIVSKGVRLGTLSKYSHAAIYVGGTMIEATLSGVFSKNPQRLIFDSKDHVAVYRYDGELTESQVEVICSFARSKICSLYSIPEATTLRFRELLKKPATKQQFCSRLVALSYSESGVNLKNLRNPAYCTPKQLSLCKAFYKVDHMVREATSDEVSFSTTEDPNITHQKETTEWVREVRKLSQTNDLSVKYDIQTINDVDEFLYENRTFNDSILEFVKNGGYLTYYKYDTKRNPWRYDRALLEAVVISHPDKESFLEAQLKISFNIFNLYRNNLVKYLEYYSSTGLSYYKEHSYLYYNLMNLIYVRSKNINEVSEKLGFKKEAFISQEVMNRAKANCEIATQVIDRCVSA
nr:YiiX/YebB-like N1pC/P60 family cysteine hydrolase [Vibrio alginolyticus]